jgi:glutathione-regulated potassium-efflux system ancillary protein KefC
VEQVWFTAAIWLGLALLATLLSIWLRVSVALTEIVVGTAAQFVIAGLIGPGVLAARAGWIAFLAGLGAIVLTFLAGVELEPESFRRNWKEATIVGLVGFAAPFLGATWAANALLGWDFRASMLAGVALSTTSVAVVYAVLLELGLNRTAYGKIILAACFINDLGTVIALGLIFAPFTLRSLGFVVGLGAALWVLFRTTGPIFKRYGGRTAEVETKLLLFALLLLGGLAVWSGSEAVLPAYMIGMVLAGTVGADHTLVRRLRTLTFGLLTPFYFIRAGSFVDIPTVLGGLGIFAVLFFAKAISKFVGIFPLTRRYGYPHGEGMYTTLLMSTGLTFGTISALYGLSNNIITQTQYSFLVATVIASAVIPTWIANRFFLPVRHLPKEAAEPQPATTTGGA